MTSSPWAITTREFNRRKALRDAIAPPPVKRIETWECNPLDRTRIEHDIAKSQAYMQSIGQVPVTERPGFKLIDNGEVPRGYIRSHRSDLDGFREVAL